MESTLAITGLGAITPLGIGVEEYWNNLVKGHCGIRGISSFDASELAVSIAAEVRGFHPEDFLPRKLIHQTDAFTQFAFAAASQALDGHRPIAPDRFGVVVGTSLAGISTAAATQEALTKAVHKNVGPRFVPRILGNIAAAHISIAHNIMGPSYTVSTACASGNDAIILGSRLLLCHEADAVLVVGTESILCPLVIYALANARVLSRSNEDPQGACRPFDRARNGFVIGEGAGALLLERTDDAQQQNSPIYGFVQGWANNNDAYGIVTPEPEGNQAFRCMEQALRHAGLTPDDIGYINAHGTGTQAGDSAEAKAIERVFGSSQPAISSTKGATGHLMGAGGVIEAIVCLKAMETSLLPPNLNLDDPEFNLSFIRHGAMSREVRFAMSNAFGFGGQNSTLIFGRDA